MLNRVNRIRNLQTMLCSSQPSIIYSKQTPFSSSNNNPNDQEPDPRGSKETLKHKNSKLTKASLYPILGGFAILLVGEIFIFMSADK